MRKRINRGASLGCDGKSLRNFKAASINRKSTHKMPVFPDCHPNGIIAKSLTTIPGLRNGKAAMSEKGTYEEKTLCRIF